MSIRFYYSIVLLLFINAVQAQTIDADRLKKHITYLASDKLKGRGTGSVEEKKAAAYIAKHLKKQGCNLKATMAPGCTSLALKNLAHMAQFWKVPHKYTAKM